jgi:hypothetical protein
MIRHAIAHGIRLVGSHRTRLFGSAVGTESVTDDDMFTALDAMLERGRLFNQVKGRGKKYSLPLLSASGLPAIMAKRVLMTPESLVDIPPQFGFPLNLDYPSEEDFRRIRNRRGGARTFRTPPRGRAFPPRRGYRSSTPSVDAQGLPHGG